MKIKRISDFFCILILYAIVMQPLFGMTLYYVLVGLLSFFTFVSILESNKLKINIHVILLSLFVIWGFTSKIWAISQEGANYAIKETFLAVLISFCLAEYLERRKENQTYESRLIRLFDSFTNATFLMSIYLLIFDLPKVLKTFVRLGYYIFENYGTYMVFSYSLIISLCFLFWKMFYIKRDRLTILKFVVVFITSIFSGTRKTLLCLIIFAIMIVFLKYRKNIINIIKFVIIGFVSLLFLYGIITTNESLYKLIGRRIENIILIVVKDDDSKVNDASITERNLLKHLSMDAFLEKPITGWGINNFANYSRNHSGPFLYAHNNYLEILSSLGLIGFTIYYGSYILLLLKASKSLKKEGNSVYIFIFCFLVMTLVSDYSTGSYIRVHYIFTFLVFAKYIWEKAKQIENS